MTRRHSLAALALVAALLIAAACGGDGDDNDDDTTPTAPAATSTTDAAETPDPAEAGIIRTLDLEANADVQTALTETGGRYVQDNVIYADITNDGIDEAVVPIASGGTLGNVAFVVLTPDGAGADTLISEQPEGTNGMALRVEDGDLVVSEAVPGPDDPSCCPSMLRETTYAWNGAALAIVDEVTIPNPDGGIKGTPVAAE